MTTINVLDGKNVTFTQADAGKTFTYEAAETAGTNTAYTYDTDVRTVTVKVKDNNNSTLTVTTRVTKVKDGQEVIVDEQEVTTGEVGQKKSDYIVCKYIQRRTGRAWRRRKREDQRDKDAGKQTADRRRIYV